MSQRKYQNMAMDARPDRLDLRDREYRPRLRSLPPQYPEPKKVDKYIDCYVEQGLILDQGQEGACTGFGLAAVINYLIWRDHLQDDNDHPTCPPNLKVNRVSERMLYHMAQIYDEWDGEDYSGSSCRGAMKGWHRHGVCKKSLWEYRSDGKFLRPKAGWESDAIQNPLGAYYRISKGSVADMQSAIYEVGAVYCSAGVHKGWWNPKKSKLSEIVFSEKQTGGHAFALVGYNEAGFIVQNSWGEGWGYRGFAILTYRDWVINGSDAWAMARGVPIASKAAPVTFSSKPLHLLSTDGADRASASIKNALNYPYRQNEIRPWDESAAYRHSLVIGNKGRPKHTMIESENADQSAWQICYHNIRHWMGESPKNRKIAIYVHGGLNSESAAVARVRVMAPYFKANGVYPVFIIWKTGLLETLTNMIKDIVDDLIFDTELPSSQQRAEGWPWFQDRIDNTIEGLARAVRVNAIWSEMKENAMNASDRAVPGYPQQGAGVRSGAMVIFAKALQKLVNEVDKAQIHLMSHSAGSILLGSWLRELEKRRLMVRSVTLYAPACTVGFANKYYIRAVEKEVFRKKSLYIHMMDDEREKADSLAGAYKKSLLYLVSRSLEEPRKMPLLGMEAVWRSEHNSKRGDTCVFHESQIHEIKKWTDFIKTGRKPEIYRKDRSRVVINEKQDTIPLAHTSFDNDINVISKTLGRIMGTGLDFEIENLAGF